MTPRTMPTNIPPRYTPAQIASQARRREIYGAVGGLGGAYQGSTRGSLYDRLGVPEGIGEHDPRVTEALANRQPQTPTVAPPLGLPQPQAPTQPGTVQGSNFRQGRHDRMKKRFGGVQRAPGVQTTAPPAPMGGVL